MIYHMLFYSGVREGGFGNDMMIPQHEKRLRSFRATNAKIYFKNKSCILYFSSQCCET